ncbi:hypothetical protein ACER0C_002795 [Sarotherodon galilaeus]
MKCFLSWRQNQQLDCFPTAGLTGTLIFLRGSTCASSPLSSTCYSEGTSSMMEELLESAESFLQSETSVTVQRIYGSRDLHGH